MRAKRRPKPAVIEVEMIELRCCVCKVKTIRVLKQVPQPEYRCSFGCGRPKPWQGVVGNSAPKRQQ